MRAEVEPSQLGIFDPPIARARRDDGIKRAADHADEIIPSWGDKALAALRRLGPQFGTFSAAHVRHRAHAEGLALPPDPRAWGSVFTRARKSCLIEFVRYVPDPDPKSHACPRAEYRWIGE